MCSPYSQAHLEILCVYLYSQVALHLCCSFGWQSVSHTLRTWRASLERALARALPPLSLSISCSLSLARVFAVSLTHTRARALSLSFCCLPCPRPLSLSFSFFLLFRSLSLSLSLSRMYSLPHTLSLALFFCVRLALSRFLSLGLSVTYTCHTRHFLIYRQYRQLLRQVHLRQSCHTHD